MALCCAVVLDPYSNDHFEAIRMAPLDPGSISKKEYQQLVEQGNVLDTGKIRIPRTQRPCGTATKDVDFLTKSAVVEVCSLFSVPMHRGILGPHSQPLAH